MKNTILLNNMVYLFKYRGTRIGYLVLLFLMSSILSCKKLVDIPEPIDTITTVKMFDNDANANTAIAGIYYKMNLSALNGNITIYPALSGDELTVGSGPEVFYLNNSILVDDDKFWTSLYGVIYSTNAVIEGLENSKNLSSSSVNKYKGEAKFLRALCFFYLVNLFGDVPLVTTTNFKTNSLLSRVPSSQIYEQIIDDLNDAQNLLPSDFSASGGVRIRANKWAASALLSRVDLYVQKWEDAEANASSVILNSNYFSLVNDLNMVFKYDSPETIFQLEISTSPYATSEGSQFIPEYLTRNFDSATVAGNWSYFIPRFSLTNNLVNAFEAGDNRKLKWVDSTGEYNGQNFYYPYKYKDRRGNAGAVSEYNILLRLAEQYLIRSEARAHLNNINGAIDDLNAIRVRAGLPQLPYSLSQNEILSALASERRVEFLSECGHRWLDLKRSGQLNSIMTNAKGSNWQVTDDLYPIPKSEILTNPNLVQNSGYQ